MNGRALVLNATYEPICVVPLRRAVVLVMMEKAEVVSEQEHMVHSASLDFPMPSVIRLVRYVRIPFRARAPLTRRNVLTRDMWRCAYCNLKADTIDHVIPRSKGGGHVWENVVAACKRCNHSKGDRTPAQAGLSLGVRPKAPTGLMALIVVIGVIEEQWEPFLIEAAA